MFLDSHCHLEMESFEKDRDHVVERSITGGLTHILTVGTEERYFDRVTAIVARYPVVYGAAGIHPHNSTEFNPRVADRLRSLLRRPKMVAYGEIGLDFFKNYSPREAQIRAFREQIDLARELRLPMIIHSRDAKEDTIRILKEAGESAEGGVIHCYSYDVDGVKRFLDMGFYISIPGTITFSRNEQGAAVVRTIPDNRILAETDAPFLTPAPHRGKRNEPGFVKLTIQKIAEIKGRSVDGIASSIHENFSRLFCKINERDSI